MNIWAISDLHLCFGATEKSMEVFGPKWQNYTTKIKENWKKNVSSQDLVLICGDISWAKKLEDAVIDLEWIDSLPGEKVIIKGNHDYWWTSLNKVKKILPKSIHIIQNDAFLFHDVAIGGTRLWDTNEYNFTDYIDFQENMHISSKEKCVQEDQQEKIFQRELQRLGLSLSQMDRKAKTKIVMTHYPPIGPALQPSKAEKIMEKFAIDICVFGHLHSLKDIPIFSGSSKIKYYLTSCDYINFCPIRII